MLQRLLILLFIGVSNSFSQGIGTLDNSFGSNGAVVIDIGHFDNCRDVISVDDGGVFIFGSSGLPDTIGFDFDALIIKLDENGDYDSSFGQGGKLFFDCPLNTCTAVTDAAITDTFIYVIGDSYEYGRADTQDVFIARFFRDGSIDASFNTNGFFYKEYIGTYNTAGEIEASDNGDVYYTLTAYDSAYNHLEVPVLGRLLSNGSLDTNFSGTGEVSWRPVGGWSPMSFQGAESRHFDGAQLPYICLKNDKIFLGGWYYLGERSVCLSAIFNNDGTMNQYYSQNGVLVYDLSPNMNNSVTDIHVLGDNRILLFCDAEEPDLLKDFIIREVDTLGVFQHTHYLDCAGGIETSKEALIDDNGNVLLAGYSKEPWNTHPGYESDFAGLVALRNDYSPINSFANNSVGQYDLNLGNEIGANAISMADNSIYLGGYSSTISGSGYTDIVLFKLHSSESLSVPESVGLPKIFPNPTRGLIQFPYNLTTVEVFDLEGRRLLSSSNISTSTYSLESVNAGTYFIVGTDMLGNTHTHKIIKVD